MRHLALALACLLASCTLATRLSASQSARACEQLAEQIYDASQAGTDELSEQQFCSSYPADPACNQAMQLSCEIGD